MNVEAAQLEVDDDSPFSSEQVLVCLVIAACANVLKTLAAKLLATSFHRQAHFDKMQDALSKVRISKGQSFSIGPFGTCMRVISCHCRHDPG